MTVVLDAVALSQMEQTNRVDAFIAAELAPIFMQGAENIHKQGEMLGLAIKEAGPMGRERLRRLVNFEFLGFAVQSAMKTVTDHLLLRLSEEQLALMMEGFEDAEEWSDIQGLPGGIIFTLPDNRDIFLNPSLQAKFDSLGLSILTSLEKHLLAGIPFTENPEDLIRKEIDRALGAGMIWAIGMTTMAMWSVYREGITTYMKNAGIEGWYWIARLDMKTCPSCISLHGTWHPASESLNDHPRGRCEPLPAPEGSLDIPTGKEWFKGRSDADQLQILGGAKFRAWQAGEINVEDFSTEYLHPVYGSIRKESSLRNILGSGAQEFYHGKGG